MRDNPYIVNLNHAEEFSTLVLMHSQEAPVIVDFWAAWCAPCKMLLPVLDKLAHEFQGHLRVVKINIDEQQELATQFGIRSVPTLKLFRHGKEVGELMGAQPEQALRQWIDPHLERALDKHRAKARDLHAQGRSLDAVAVLQEAIALDPNYYRLHQDLLAILSENGQFYEAQTLFDSLPANIQAEAEVQAILPRLAFGAILAKAPPRAELEKQGNDVRARYYLSAYQVLAGEFEAALENLFAIMRQDRSFEDDGARKSILHIFTLLGDDPRVSRYRAKLSALLY
jgi:putative thioredoxin